MRLFFGFLFFGSVDFLNGLSLANCLLSEHYPPVPYFPLMYVFTLAGALNVRFTSLPIPLSYKLLPIFFDAGIAAFICHVLKGQKNPLAERAANLYAFSPLAVIITCLHFHYEPVFLFLLIYAFYLRDLCRPFRLTSLLFGIFFMAAILVKPVAVIFIFVFYDMWRRPTRQSFAACCGALLTLVFFLAMMIVSGQSIPDTIRNIIFYGDQNVSIFGSPHAIRSTFPFLPSIGNAWILILLLALSRAVWKHSMRSLDYLLSGFLLSIAFGRLGPQYLIWPLPFLCLTGRLRQASIYSLVCTAFLVFYYLNPEASYVPFENMTTFSILRFFSAWAPPEIYTRPDWIPLIKLLGNLGIPLLSLGLFIHLLFRHRTDGPLSEKPAAGVRTTLALLIFSLGAITLMAFIPFLWPLRLQTHFAAAVTAKSSIYSMQMINRDWTVRYTNDHYFFNSANIFLLWATTAVFVTFMLAVFDRKRKTCS